MWILYDSDDKPINIGNNNSTTDSDGVINIKLKVDGNEFKNVKNDQLYKLKIKASKETLSDNNKILHTFLCGNEDVECPVDGTDIYLKHLEFDKTVNFADNTSVPITEKVTVDGTPCAIKEA